MSNFQNKINQMITIVAGLHGIKTGQEKQLKVQESQLKAQETAVYRDILNINREEHLEDIENKVGLSEEELAERNIRRAPSTYKAYELLGEGVPGAYEPQKEDLRRNVIKNIQTLDKSFKYDDSMNMEKLLQEASLRIRNKKSMGDINYGEE